MILDVARVGFGCCRLCRNAADAADLPGLLSQSLSHLVEGGFGFGPGALTPGPYKPQVTPI